MNKEDLLTIAKKKTGFDVNKSRAVFDAMTDEIKKGLLSNREIHIRGFGTFKNKVRKPRPARNIRTGESIALGYRIVPVCKLHAP